MFESLLPLVKLRLPTSADIRHIGATTVWGCLTKGDLDVVVRVSLGDFPEADAVLSALFARNVGSPKMTTSPPPRVSQAIPRLAFSSLRSVANLTVSIISWKRRWHRHNSYPHTMR